MQNAVSYQPAIVGSDRSTSRLFFAVLALATAVPLFGLPLYPMTHASTLTNVILGVWILAYGHVMSTIWFGLDLDYKPVVQAHRLRMVASLLAIPAAMAVITFVSPSIWSWIFAGFLAWQAHHFNRQNYGIISFAAVHDDLGAMPAQVGWIVNLTSAAGAIGMMRMPAIYPQGFGNVAFLSHAFSQYGLAGAIVLFIAAVVVLAHLIATNRRIRHSPTVLLFLGLTAAFFVPSLLPGSQTVSFWPYTMAHGIQYLIMVGIASKKSRHGWLGLGMFTMIAVGLGVLAVSMRGLPWVQIYTGIIMWHFLADARLWRLRDPTVRAIVRGRFDFLFGSGSPTRIPASGLAPAASAN